MEGTGHIEGLSLWFAAGVMAGTALSGHFQQIYWVAGILPAILLVPVILQKSLERSSDITAVTVLSGEFLFLGIFSALNASLPGISTEAPFKSLAGDAVLGLRALIAGIPFPHQGTGPLLLALLTGEKSALPRGAVAVFRESGASHLLALSGLHLGILYLLFDHLTRALGHSPAARRLRYGLILLSAGFYTLMTGASPSLVRAFLFIALNETLRLLGRPRNAVRVLCLALFIQLVLDPSVIRSVGFQLSYLAMAGIFLLYPVLESWYPTAEHIDPIRSIWKTAALSLSCQVFTGPLVWFRFHTFPKYFLLTNLLAIPLTSGLMASAVITVILSGAGCCPELLIRATDVLCSLLLQVLEIISSM